MLTCCCLRRTHKHEQPPALVQYIHCVHEHSAFFLHNVTRAIISARELSLNRRVFRLPRTPDTPFALPSSGSAPGAGLSDIDSTVVVCLECRIEVRWHAVRARGRLAVVRPLGARRCVGTKKKRNARGQRGIMGRVHPEMMYVGWPTFRRTTTTSESAHPGTRQSDTGQEK